MHRSLMLLLLFAISASFALRAQARGLHLHPDNPRYYVDDDGHDVLLVGFGSLTPSVRDLSPTENVDYWADLGSSYARVWHLLPWGYRDVLWPWPSDTGVAAGGFDGSAFDLARFDESYWTRMRELLSRAEERGIIAEPHLFDRCGMSPAADDRWQQHPFASDNNINGTETPPSSEDGTPEVYALDDAPVLWGVQQAYVDRFVDELAAYPDVIVEVENEHWDSDITFASTVAARVKDRLAQLGVQRLVAYSSIDADLEDAFFVPDIDVVNAHWGGELDGDPTIARRFLMDHWAIGKAVSVDEFANGVGDPALLRHTDDYVRGVAERMLRFGICAIQDPNAGDELATKPPDNSYYEGFDILTSTNFVRRPPGAYTGHCTPAWF